MKLDGSSVATFAPGQQAPTVTPSFVNRFNATWVPNQLTLILLNVTAAEEGEYLCEVVSVGGLIQTWYRTIHVSLLGKHSQLVKRILMIYDLLHFTGQEIQLPRGKGHKRTSRSHTKVLYLTQSPIHV